MSVCPEVKWQVLTSLRCKQYFTCLNPCLCISACTCLVLQSNLARGQSAGDPDQIQCFEGNEHEADVGCQIFGTLWVHEVVSGVAARVFLVAHRGGQIYPRRECDGGTA